MMGRGIVILGATSTIARSVVMHLAQRDDRICLAARTMTELRRVAEDLRLRRDPCLVVEQEFDTGLPHTHGEIAKHIWSTLAGVDIVIACTGELGDQDAARHDPLAIHRIIHSNYAGVATILAPFIDRMEERRAGNVIVLSSVAGDRARQSNYIYGSAKAGIDAYFAGLRNRLQGTGVTALTIKLGFTDTRMVHGKSGMFLVASPEAVARSIVGCIGRSASVVYVPWFWRFIMLVIRSIPSFLFNRLRL